MNSEEIERESVRQINSDLARTVAEDALRRRRPEVTSGAVNDAPSRPEFEARLGQARAESETQFEKLRGEFRGEFKAINARLDHLPSTWTMVTTIAGTGIGIVAAMLAALALASGTFGQGMSASQIAHQAAVEALSAHNLIGR